VLLSVVFDFEFEVFDLLVLYVFQHHLFLVDVLLGEGDVDGGLLDFLVDQDVGALVDAELSALAREKTLVIVVESGEGRIFFAAETLLLEV
jgi:hypothetical protein